MNRSIKTRYGFAFLASLLFLVFALINQSWQALISVAEDTVTLVPRYSQLASIDGAGSGLIGWWKFDEGSGTTAGDSSGNGNTGTFSGNPTWVDGHDGKALSFTTSSLIVIPHNDDLNTSNELTLSFWINAKSYSSSYANRFLTKWSNTTDANFSFYYFGQTSVDPSPGHVQLFANSGGTWKKNSDAALLPLNSWVHVAVSYSATSGGQLYINGQPQGSLTGGGALTNNQKLLGIGGLDGSIDDVRIYNRALSASEVASLSGSVAANATNTTTNTNQNSTVVASSANNTTSNNNQSTNNSTSNNNPASDNSNNLSSTVNLALGKPYTLSPAPNYALCTDSGDSVQLTDGKYVSGYFWIQQGTVGWQAVPVSTVTIDLGKSEPISGLSYNTAAGGAGATFPAAIYVFVSDDGSNWHWVTDMVEQTYNDTLKPVANQYSLYKYKARDLKSHGRYVKLATVLSGPFAFVDEIEVYKGDDSFLNIPYTADSLVAPADFISGNILNTKLHLRLRGDINDVSNSITASALSSSEKNALKASLDSLGGQISSVTISSPDSFSTVFPINDLQKRIYAVQASLWRSRGLGTLTVWPAFRWDMLTPTSVPQSGGVSLNMSMMDNEYRAQTFNISNAGSTDADVKFSIEGLPGGANPSYINVHEAIFTDTTTNVPVAAALPVLARQGNQYIVRISSGLTKQIWLTFHPVGVASGDYQGQVKLEGAGLNVSAVPLRLKIYPFRFPDSPSLHLGGWDYTNGNGQSYSVTPQNRAAFIQHLREHYVDTPWASSSVMPSGIYDVNGHMTQAPDSTAFREWVSRWPMTENYFIFSNVQDKFAGFQMGTPAFTQAVKEWINWWAGQFKSSSINLKQIALLLRDEPGDAINDNIIIQYAKIIRATQPEINVFEDIAWKDPSQATPDAINLSQILSPHLPTWLYSPKSYGDFYVSQRDKGHELWFYSASGRLLDPYTYFLTSAWFSWKYGAKGENFWAFGDGGGTWGYNEYTGTNIYTPMFISKIDVVAGKQMEAIREGVEDYEYMKILNDRVKSLEASGVTSSILTAARTLLNGAADRVTADRANNRNDAWTTAKDRTVSEQVRLQILEMLTQLNQFFPNTTDLPPLTPTPTPTPDTVAPILTLAPTTSYITPNSSTIVFYTDEPATTQVEYGITTSYGNQTAIDSSLMTSHSRSLSNLAPSTLYHYRILTKDSAGNQTISTDQTFTTLKIGATPVVIPVITQPVNVQTSKNTIYPDTSIKLGTTLYKSSPAKPTAFKPITNLDNSLLSIPTTTIDIVVPKVPSWIEVLIALLKEIVNRIKMGAGRTVTEIWGLF